MTHSLIKLRDSGKDLSNRYTGAILRSHIIASAANPEQKTIVDFEGVRTISESFADELFAVLVEDAGFDWFRNHLELRNLTSNIRHTILRTISDRVEHA